MSGRVLALDVGDRRIGVAVSGPLGVTAQGLETITRDDEAQVMGRLRALVAELNVVRLVVGWPLQMSGREGAATQKVRRFAATLEAELGLPVDRWDERLTTVAAERALLEGGLRRDRRRQVIDKVAATLILQGYLEGRPQSHEEGDRS